MSKHAALFALALCVSAGWTLGRLLALALFNAARSALTRKDKDGAKGKRLFR